jgi:hypothetical protein
MAGPTETQPASEMAGTTEMQPASEITRDDTTLLPNAAGFNIS